MRVLYFSRDYTTHDYRFLSKLVQSPHEIWYLRLENGRIPYERRPLPEGIHHVEWQGGHQRVNNFQDWIRLLPDLERVICELQPELIHTVHIQSCGFMTAMLGFHPLLIMSCASDILVEADRDEFWRWLTCYTFDRSDMLICDSYVVKEKAQQMVNYSNERIVQFPWGVDLLKFSPGKDMLGIRIRLGWEPNFILVSTRRWELNYGIDTLLKAFHLTYCQNTNLRLILLGTGSLAQEVSEFINCNDLSDVIYAPGQISHIDLPNFFRAADAYVSCSHSDGSSISLLEAMAIGLPVVVSDIPSNREWVTHKKNGWLVPVGDAEALADVILEITKKPYYIQQMQIINQAISKQRADWDNNFQLLLDAYQKFEKK